MDYHPVCLLDGGNTLFQTKPGPYDMGLYNAWI